MAGKDRNILKSLMAYVRGLLLAPPAATGWAAFKVYNEKDMTAMSNGAPMPAWPYIFLLEAYMRPKPALLPMLIVEIPLTRKIPYELGNRNGRTQEALLHCFGRDRGQVLDLSSFFVDYLGATFPINTYTAGPSGDTATFVENAEVVPDIMASPGSWKINQEMRREDTLDHWMIVELQFRTKN